jgi:hypothetical protein
MGTWGPVNFASDAALDFIGGEIDRYVGIIQAIFADGQRFRLDEDAEGMLVPCVELLSLLLEHGDAVLPKNLDVAAWKARYLEMYDDQIDGLEPTEGYKQQRRVAIEATFDKLQKQHEEQWRK